MRGDVAAALRAPSRADPRARESRSRQTRVPATCNRLATGAGRVATSLPLTSWRRGGRGAAHFTRARRCGGRLARRRTEHLSRRERCPPRGDGRRDPRGHCVPRAHAAPFAPRATGRRRCGLRNAPRLASSPGPGRRYTGCKVGKASRAHQCAPGTGERAPQAVHPSPRVDPLARRAPASERRARRVIAALRAVWHASCTSRAAVCDAATATPARGRRR